MFGKVLRTMTMTVHKIIKPSQFALNPYQYHFKLSSNHVMIDCSRIFLELRCYGLFYLYTALAENGK